MPPLTSDPSLPERIARYRAKAEAALRQAAATTDPALHNGLLHLAAGWHGLARELETNIAGLAAAKPEPASRRAQS